MSLYNDLAIRHFLTSQLRRVADSHRGIVLDLGCGDQPYRALYAHLFRKVITSDFELRSAVDVQLDSSAIPFADESFDVVLMTEVIEHVPDSVRTLKEVSRILKSGGILLITWPFLHPLHEIPHDYTRLTEFGMQHLAEQAGLRIEALERRGDVFCVGGTIVEHFASSLLVLASRVPVIGRLLGPVQSIFESALRALWKLYLRHADYARRLHPPHAGDHLKGVVDHLSLWTSGYCARAVKIT